MPLIECIEVDGYWHCSDALCAGYNQQPTRAFQETVSWTFGDRGCDPNVLDPGRIESSNTRLRPVNDDERPCPHCPNTRELTTQERPKYRNLSGVDPNFMLKQLARERAMQEGEDVYVDKEDRVAELERLNADLAARLDAIETKPTKRPAAA